ncbi:MAG TPA: hypothetical protein VKE40_20100 [Gemmataceae bacterium]|nr:hypothetical protein [Gemmataceae bacterium]
MAAAVNHANNYWYRSCADGDVWTPNAPVNANRECAARGLNPAEWAGRFLNYERPGSLAEGLFLIPAAIGHPAIIKARDFMARNFPDRHFLCSWSDSKKDTFEGQTPPYTGLNDCSHFVSECLQKGGVSTWSLNAPGLVKGLRARPDTKTLCHQVDKDAARWIINCGLLTPGDVVAYSDWTGFRHATLYLGGRMIAMHTSANHPDGNPSFLRNDQNGPNNWESSAHAAHPNITLIHFGDRDADTRPVRWAHGWWKVTGASGVFYYHFTPEGQTGWTSSSPTTLTRPPDNPGGRGYWFINPDGSIQVCWRDTGMLEFFRPQPNQAMTGASTGEVLNGVRLGP